MLEIRAVVNENIEATDHVGARQCSGSDAGLNHPDILGLPRFMRPSDQSRSVFRDGRRLAIILRKLREQLFEENGYSFSAALIVLDARDLRTRLQLKVANATVLIDARVSLVVIIEQVRIKQR